MENPKRLVYLPWSVSPVTSGWVVRYYSEKIRNPFKRGSVGGLKLSKSITLFLILNFLLVFNSYWSFRLLVLMTGSVSNLGLTPEVNI